MTVGKKKKLTIFNAIISPPSASYFGIVSDQPLSLQLTQGPLCSKQRAAADLCFLEVLKPLPICCPHYTLSI